MYCWISYHTLSTTIWDIKEYCLLQPLALLHQTVYGSNTLESVAGWTSLKGDSVKPLSVTAPLGFQQTPLEFKSWHRLVSYSYHFSNSKCTKSKNRNHCLISTALKNINCYRTSDLIAIARSKWYFHADLPNLIYMYLKTVCISAMAILFFFLHIYEIISTSYSFYTGIDHAYHAALLEGVCLEFAQT